MQQYLFLVFMIICGVFGTAAIIFALRAKHLWNGKPIGILRRGSIIFMGMLLIMLSLVTIPPEFGWQLPAIVLNLFVLAYPIVGGGALLSMLLVLLASVVERAHENHEGRQA